jgi:hypothetical protein
MKNIDVKFSLLRVDKSLGRSSCFCLEFWQISLFPNDMKYSVDETLRDLLITFSDTYQLFSLPANKVHVVGVK